MCQLLGMNCNVPTDIRFSFEGFSARGGGNDVHADGWGIAFFEGPACRLFRDAEAARTSPLAELVRRVPIRSKHVVSHIRKATQGAPALQNCHPFTRGLWGRAWAFAHNGHLALPPAEPRLYRPVGETDSEVAFCAILDELRAAAPEAKPPLPALLDVLASITGRLAAHGPFNYLLSDGEHLFAHCSTRLHWIVRQAPFAEAHLIDPDLTVDFRALTGPDDRVAVLATAPLTDNEVWTPMEPGEILVFRDGAPVESRDARPASPAAPREAARLQAA